MSIYSGFATRAQEEIYDQCIDSLLFVLQKRILKFYKNQEADQDRFVSLVLKMHQQLRTMENSKYLEPKTSQTINELVKVMQVHHKNTLLDKSKTPNYGMEYPVTHEPLPAVEHKPRSEENAPKKKQSLWVEKAPRRESLVDQEMQTMGTIVDKKESLKGNSLSRSKNQRNVISSLRTKYGNKFTGVKPSREHELPPTQNRGLGNRSHSHHLGNNQTFTYDYEVRNHLKELEATNKKKRRAKLSHRLGLKDLPTEERSEYEVGDIIKDYVSRVKRGAQKESNQRGPRDNRMDDF